MSHGWILVLMGGLFLGLGYLGVPVAFSITAGVLVATMLTPISLTGLIPRRSWRCRSSSWSAS